MLLFDSRMTRICGLYRDLHRAEHSLSNRVRQVYGVSFIYVSFSVFSVNARLHAFVSSFGLVMASVNDAIDDEKSKDVELAVSRPCTGKENVHEEDSIDEKRRENHDLTSTPSSNSISISERDGGDLANPEGADLEAQRATSISPPVHSIFTRRQKIFIIFMVSWGGLISPITSQIYFPALNTLSKDLHVSNTAINLTLFSYMVFQGLAPSIMGDLSDMAGRRPTIAIGFAIYIAANIGKGCPSVRGCLR